MEGGINVGLRAPGHDGLPLWVWALNSNSCSKTKNTIVIDGELTSTGSLMVLLVIKELMKFLDQKFHRNNESYKMKTA